MESCRKARLSECRVLLLVENTEGEIISGEKVFELYDTFGFPKDLTALILREKGLELDEVSFDKAMLSQKNRSRSAATVDTDAWVILHDNSEGEFIGYDALSADVKITRYRKVTSKKDGELYQLVFNTTPFYPEGGGQVGDKGYLEVPNGNVVYIVNTKKENNLIIHFTKDLPRDSSTTFKATVDEKQRFRTACNHTATHLLHQALREILGTHVEQKGSAVHTNYLRFDFSHFSKLTNQELKDVENFVNARVNNKIALEENRNTTMNPLQETTIVHLVPAIIINVKNTTLRQEHQRINMHYRAKNSCHVFEETREKSDKSKQ